MRDPVVLSSDRVSLIPTSPTHYEALYRLIQDPQVLVAWRTRGAHPSFESFVQLIWQDSFVSFTVVDEQQGIVGLVSLYGVDLRNRFGYVSLVVSPHTSGTRAAFDVAMLFLNYVRLNLSLVNVYAEIGAAASSSFGLGFGRLFTVEARLQGREYFDGAFGDVLLARCEMAEVGPRLDEFQARLRR